MTNRTIQINDMDLWREFKSVCTRECINLSERVEELIEKDVKRFNKAFEKKALAKDNKKGGT